MGALVVGERVYLDANGKATTDESAGVSLWHTEGDEVTEEEAADVGYKAGAKVESSEEETSYRDLQARAKELGLPAGGSREELEERISEAEGQ